MKAACEDCSCVQSYPHAKHDVHAPQSEALIATGKELPFARQDGKKSQAGGEGEVTP